VATYVAPHAGRRIVLHVDLREFFPSIRSSRINALLRTAGYGEPVARLITGLCTNAVPAEVFGDLEQDSRVRRMRGFYGGPHLPQGAPTSPALANLCAYRLDQRLSALAEKFDARYSRYADDLLFSGGEDLERGLRRFRLLVCAIALDEGFSIRSRKTRILRQSTAQRVAGVVLNVHPNLPRKEFDTLKALLHNCAAYGPESQNLQGHASFREHLQGRVAYYAVINPRRAETLQRLFEKIVW
jgi:hypothetical protein